MNLAGIIFPAFNAYPGVAYEIYVSGCTRKCNGCHSPELQDFSYGEPLNILNLIKDIRKQDGTESIKWIDIISILGGDLLCQNETEALSFVKALKRAFPRKKFYLFTGAELPEIPPIYLQLFDAIKTGRYIEQLKQDGFPASSNQKLNLKREDY